MPLFSKKPTRFAIGDAEHPAILREVYRLYFKKCDTVLGDIRFASLLAPHFSQLAGDLSALASEALPLLSQAEAMLPAELARKEITDATEQAPAVSLENAHAVALAYCKNRLQTVKSEQAAVRRLQQFAKSVQTQGLLARWQVHLCEENTFLLHIEKRLSLS